MANGSGIELPKVSFTTLDPDKIEIGSYFIGFDQGNDDKLSKMDHLGNITLIEGANGGQPLPEYTYEIGQYVASQGGVIFHRYKDGTTEHYLVVAVTTTTGGARWDDNIMFPLLGASSSWDGTSNYTLISAATGSQLSSAANAINYYNTVAPVTGWYLPAVDEVNLLFNNRFNINRTLSGNSSFGTVPGASEIAYNIYWTSTEVSNSQARAFEFISGTVTSVNKSTSYYVRAIRKFSLFI